VISSSVVCVDGGRAASVARFFSRQTIVAAFVAVIAMVFHVTGSTGPEATANQSVLVLAILIAQITMPRRQLRDLLRAPSNASQPN
jgi:predicted dinucleotide-binding enzyme